MVRVYCAQRGDIMLKCVIFDMDGTIADTLPLCIHCFRHAAWQLFKLRLTDEQILAAFGPSEEGTIALLLPGRHDEGVELFLSEYQRLHADMCPGLFGGIGELVADIKRMGAKAAIVTGKGPRAMDISMRALGMQGWFDHVETGSSKGPVKPECIRRTLDVLSVDASEAVYIGDSVSDVDSSLTASVKALSAAWADTADVQGLLKRNPEYTYLTVDSLRGYLIDNLMR